MSRGHNTPNHEWLPVLTRLTEAAEPCVLITVTEAKGSTPREAGVKMVATAKEQFGTIGGGNLEFQALEAARALLVDRNALAAAQEAGDVLGANGILMDAFYTDVRPVLAAWRESRGFDGDPMTAYALSGYQETIEADRVGGVQAGWGA